MEVPDFDGRLDPTIFPNWLASIAEYFHWYNMTDEKSELCQDEAGRPNKVWWTSIEGHIRRLRQPPISIWQDMKAKLQEKYTPANFHNKLCE